MSAPLVSGGVLNQTRYPPSDGSPAVPSTSFITHTVPVIYENSIIVAASHPNVNQGHLCADGWFLSDFYAFNYLLKGLGETQTWLTAADPRKLLRSDHPHTKKYLHGNPHQSRKVVLSEDLLDRDELTPVTVVKNTEMIPRFLKEVRQQSEIAVKQSAPLVLFLFCHGLENFSFLLDCGQQRKGLSPTQIKEAIEPGCRTTLITTACHSSGWAVRTLRIPSHVPLNATVMAAAEADAQSNSWHKSLKSGRVFGSIFASSVIEALTSTTSPLLVVEASEPSKEVELQPENPTPRQTATYNTLCQSILNVCRDRVTRLWQFQTFTFSAQHDAWAHSWTGRTGIPLSHFEERWKALETVPYTGSYQNKSDMDPDPSNPAFQGSAGPSMTAGELTDEMTALMVRNRVSKMVDLFLQTCPGDWDSGFGPLTRSELQSAVKGGSEQELNKASGCICFRWELGLYADQLVEEFALPRPGGAEMCVLWDSQQWVLEKRKYKLNGLVWDLLSGDGFTLFPAGGQGPPFTRFRRYMAAAVTMKELPEDETKVLVAKLIDRLAEVREFMKQRAIDEPGIRENARQWLKEIGRKVRAL
ncbi:hypothetical protein NM208_g3929 [Fusarium decemcellulare]|uniref:Uncharacterized protein n=1 Tax=Fusarium decemcellulare TaxID=57161 RepID=A0ACC1SMK2_9HYPO|nr:hypothetical protein NM208_g3929 [Fusarium decemcellulare]